MSKTKDLFPTDIRIEITVDDENLTRKRTQEVAPFVEHNKDLREISEDGQSKDPFGEGWTHTHEIPMNVALDWRINHEADLWLARWASNGRPLNDHAVKVARLLNDPEWAWLRTSKYKTPILAR